MKKILLFSVVLFVIIMAFSSCDWFETDTTHEHTWEHIQYETGHFKQYTCGCPSPDILGEHYDNDNNGICDECGYECCLAPHKHHKIINRNVNEHWWVYSCNCALPKDTESHYDNDENNRCDLCDFYMADPVLLSSTQPWLNEISSENVTQIKTVHSGEDIPSAIEKISTVTDKETIDKIIKDYQKLYIYPLDPMVLYDIPMGSFKIEFTLANGEIKRINVSGGFMYYGRYRMSAPRIDGYESAEIIYKLHKYGENWRAFFADGTYIANMCDTLYWEFIEDECHHKNESKYYMTLDLSYYTFKINVYDEYHFDFEGKCYKLINRNFDEMMGGCYELKLKQEAQKIGEEAWVDQFYGMYESGAIAGLVMNIQTGQTTAWSETVCGYTFVYDYFYMRVFVYYNDEAYTLEEAYLGNFLTEEDVKYIYNLHKYYR